MDVEGEVNLALTGLTSSKHILKHAITHRRRCEVSCLRLPCSERRYNIGIRGGGVGHIPLNIVVVGQDCCFRERTSIYIGK